MSSVKIYFMPESPPCRAVMMVAKMVNAPVEEKYLNLSTKEHLTEEFIKLNPLAKVPFIEHEGLKINESRAIIAYLANKFLPDDNAMYPRDAFKRAQVDELIHIDASIYSAGSKLLYPWMFGLTRELDNQAEEAFRRYLKYLSDRIEGNGSQRFILSDEITVADVCLAATFSLIEACEYDISDFKPLVDFINRLKSNIPDYNAINSEPINNMKAFIKSKRVEYDKTKAGE